MKPTSPLSSRRSYAIATLLAGAALATPVLAADVKLGAAEALSGPAGQYGQSIRNGFDLALEEINAAGGVKGNKLVLQIDDEAGKKEQAIDVFKKLIFQDKVLMLFGPTLSNSAQAADPIAQGGEGRRLWHLEHRRRHHLDRQLRVPQFGHRGRRAARDAARRRQARQHQEGGRALRQRPDVFTKSGYDAFKKALDDLKIPVTATETFAKGDVDFKAQLTKIKATNPDAIVLSALIAEGAPIMVQARQLGMDIPVIGGNGMNTVKIFDLAKEKSDNLWVGSPWALGSQTKENQHFVVAYTQKYKAAPDQFAAQAYDAVNVAAQALGKIKVTGNLEADRKALRDALPTVIWTGATGPFKFREAQDKDGKPAGYDAQQAAIVSVTKAGKYSIEK